MTVSIKRLTGSGPTLTTVDSTNVRCNASDNPATNETTNPVLKPVSGVNRSFWCSLQLSSDVTGTINNIRFYGDGSTISGIVVKVGTANAYIQASGSTGNGLTLNVTNHAGLNAPTVDVGDVNTPLLVAGGLVPPAVGLFGSIVVMQFEVDSIVSDGPSGAETFTFAFDSQ